MEGALPEAVDRLLSRSSRLGVWATPNVFNQVLIRLDGRGDDARLIKTFKTMVKTVGLEVKPRAVHIVVRGLLNRKKIEEATSIMELASKVPGLEIKPVTKSLFEEAVKSSSSRSKKEEALPAEGDAPDKKK